MTYPNLQFDLLKNSVLLKSGFRSIVPGDCRELSRLIKTKIKADVSETTLKRVYGFAHSKFNPSLFTVDALAKYCGYQSWDDFCVRQNNRQNKQNNENVAWRNLMLSTSKITNFTLQAIKNKSGIPYNSTIPRRFIFEHLQEFVAEGYHATLLVAPAGYGKTIALCHWIDQTLMVNGNKDIILFFSSSALMNVFLSGKDINEWLLTLMGYSTEKQEILQDVKGHGSGNFYLIIDGLDEHLFKSEDFQIIIDQLHDIFSFYESHDWFKLIITIRSANWINNRHSLDFESRKWFTGHFKDNQLTTNVPLFSIGEIRELCSKINPSVQDPIPADAELINIFHHPLYFQYFYKQNKDNFSLSSVNRLQIYEAIASLILNKVYLGPKSAEKMLLLNGLVEAMDLQNQQYDLDLLKVIDLTKAYHQSYHELIGTGFLKEVNLSRENQFRFILKFGDDHFLEYILAAWLLTNNKEIFDRQLIVQIDKLFNNSPHKVPVLKWCILHGVNSKNRQNFDVLVGAQLSPIDKSAILLFLGDLLDSHFSAENKGIGSFCLKPEIDYSDAVFNYFFELEFVETAHQQNLLTLLKFKLSDHQKILTYAGLASIAIVELNMTDLEWCLKQLKGISSAEFHSFIIDPRDCLDAIHQFLQHGAIKASFFAALTRFYFNITFQSERLKSTGHHTLINLLAAFSSQICQSPSKVLRFVHSLRYLIGTIEEHFTYCFFLNILEADSYFQLGKKREFLNIYHFILSCTESREALFTPMMSAMLYSLKIKAAIVNENYSLLASYYDCLSKICAESGNKIVRTMTSVAILNDQNLTSCYPQFIKQVNYDYLKTLREHGLGANFFITNQAI